MIPLHRRGFRSAETLAARETDTLDDEIARALAGIGRRRRGDGRRREKAGRRGRGDHRGGRRRRAE